jgi:BirA family biotin operon repressor/biotin-[acetyl-CoA-carboxylase] ligase
LGLGEREAAPAGGWQIRKLAGVLGETEGLGGDDPRVAVGIGVNGDWPADEFPVELAASMTSLREASGGRPIDHALLLDAFLARLEPRVVALRDGRFDGAGWLARQLTNGRLVRLDRPDGSAEVVRAVGVDPASGALLVEDPAGPRGERPVLSGEIHHLRLADGPLAPGDRLAPERRDPDRARTGV